MIKQLLFGILICLFLCVCYILWFTNYILDRKTDEEADKCLRWTKRIIIICILLGLGFAYWYPNHIIGDLIGPEQEKLVLHNGDVYIQSNGPYHGGDMDRMLGAARGACKYYIFTIKGEPDHDYLYAMSCGRGMVFERVSSAKE